MLCSLLTYQNMVWLCKGGDFSFDHQLEFFDHLYLRLVHIVFQHNKCIDTCKHNKNNKD